MGSDPQQSVSADAIETASTDTAEYRRKWTVCLHGEPAFAIGESNPRFVIVDEDTVRMQQRC
jgi:hypothetical protein